MKKNFRPSARLMGTIGEDIIKDMHAAVVELVKNSYDADAKNVTILFKKLSCDEILISVKDDGHGMTQETVENKWFVPATSDKQQRRLSPNGRPMQGRKGIGRFAVAILGDKLTINTISSGYLTNVEIDWNLFTSERFLDEIYIDISSQSTTKENGSTFTVVGTKEKLEMWNDKEIENLITELRKLITPINDISISDAKNNFSTDIITNDFNIYVNFENMPSEKFNSYNEKISPLPLLSHYDYRIFGEISATGNYSLRYQNKNSGIDEVVTDFHYNLLEGESFAGSFLIDFRIFDRDPEAIEQLINELYKPGEKRLKKLETKQLLNDISGVGIYRNGFRIRPYGDVNKDWLELDKKRVQNPSQKIGANQLSGAIEIQDEDISFLVEKSARDGLKEDQYYSGLVSILNQILIYTELRRFTFRKKTGKGRKKYLFSDQISMLTDYSEVTSKVFSTIEGSNVSNEKIKELNTFIEKDINVKVKIAQDIERQIAMYQGQATLGKIMDVVMHEVKKPIGWLKNQTNTISKINSRYLISKNDADLQKIIKILEESPEHLNAISSLFSRLSTLATRKRSAMQNFKMCDVINTSIIVFENEILKNNIKVVTNLDDKITFFGWKEDIVTAFTNIIENAVYWVSFQKNERIIKIDLRKEKNKIIIDFYNNGPEIIKDLLEDDTLFNPGISGKITDLGAGTGLGLSITGEAIDRNNGKIKVMDISNGAKFEIELPLVED